MLEYTEELARIIVGLRREGITVADFETIENGKPLAEARGEVALAASFFEWCASCNLRVLDSLMTLGSPARRCVPMERQFPPP